jgi:phosphoribosylformylglycinamidine synthase PurS subunit
MKLRVLVSLKPGVLDAQGRAIEHALRDLGYSQVTGVRTGKLIVLDLNTSDPAKARALAAEACEKLLANPVIEQYEILS